MFKPSIKKRVMQVVEERLDLAQKLHDEEVKELDAKHKADIKEMEEKLEKTKEEKINSVVDSFVSLLMKK